MPRFIRVVTAPSNELSSRRAMDERPFGSELSLKGVYYQLVLFFIGNTSLLLYNIRAVGKVDAIASDALTRFLFFVAITSYVFAAASMSTYFSGKFNESIKRYYRNNPRSVLWIIIFATFITVCAGLYVLLGLSNTIQYVGLSILAGIFTLVGNIFYQEFKKSQPATKDRMPA